MSEQPAQPRSDRALSERLSRDLPPGTTVLVNGKHYRVRGTHIDDDGGLTITAEARADLSVRMLDLGRALDVIVHEVPAVPEVRTYTIARTMVGAESWARDQPDTGWDVWRGANGYEPWHYLGGIGPRTAETMRGRLGPGHRLVLVDLRLHELHSALQQAVAIAAHLGATVERHEDLHRQGVTSPQRWQAWPALDQQAHR